MGFKKATKLFFTRFTDYSGRSSRSEFWYAQLFVTIATILLFVALLLIKPNNQFPIITLIYAIIFIPPHIALSFRRLHDIDKSGWWILLPSVISLIGLIANEVLPTVNAMIFEIARMACNILLIYWYCLPSTLSTIQENHSDETPKEIDKNVWDEIK